MNEKEKTEMLATGLMGWTRGTRSRWSATGFDLVGAEYWIDKEEDVIYHVSGDNGWTFDGVDDWQPFERIEHAKMVQAAMVGREIVPLVGFTKLGMVYTVSFMCWPRHVYAKASADTEARAICEAAGLALGLWKGGA